MAFQESTRGIVACLSEHAESGVSGSHSLTLPFLSTPLKTVNRMGRGKKKRTAQVVPQEMSELSYSRETGRVCVELREEQCLSWEKKLIQR